MSLSGNSQRREDKIKSEISRRTRSTANKKNEPQNTKKSPVMNSYKSKQIIIGSGNQVMLPECNKKIRKDDKIDEERDECLWNQGKLGDTEIVEFCRDALNHYGIGPDRALYILLKSDHNLKRAKSELALRNSVKKRFSVEDEFAFREAHKCFGKNFAKIHQMLSHKNLSELVEHYYLTKKQQNYKSFMDNECGKNGTSESDEEGQTQIKSELHRLICEGCQNEVLKLYSANGLELCRACKNYFKATNKHRVCAQPIEEKKRIPICPPEMKNIAEQFEEMARVVMDKQFEDTSDGLDEVQVEQNNETVCEQKIKVVSKAQKELQMEACALKKQLAMTDNKKYQSIVEEARKFVRGTAPILGKGQRMRQTHHWSDKEEMETKKALIRFGGDCKIVAELIGTKTEDMVNSFYKKNMEDIQEETKKRREIIERKMKEEAKKMCNDKAVPEIIVLDDD
ncbi:hypothetical protein niasHS_010997 [Heterodera schachtii]|uniref:SANT domain-containing protein n=1 Tax=Heterodera schachtii TaxID=97005 RepID=A0ABD2IZ93_HETSC